MKKILLFTICLSLFFHAKVSAQKSDISWGLSANVSFWDKKFMPTEIGLDVGYNLIDRLLLSVRVETAIALFDLDGVKNHYINTTGGFFAGYEFLKANDINLAFRAGIGNTILKKDWRYSYYDAGFYLSSDRFTYSPQLALGFRYYDSHIKMYDNYARIYISLGFVF